MNPSNTIYLITNGDPDIPYEEGVEGKEICADSLEEAREFVDLVKKTNKEENISEKKYIYITEYVKNTNDDSYNKIENSFVERIWID